MKWWRTIAAVVLAAIVTPVAVHAAQNQPKSVLFRNVTLIDGTGSPPLRGASVLVAGDRIAIVSAGPIEAPNGAIVVDGSGKFLMPGLIDSHIHLVGGRMPKAGGGTFVDRPLALQTLQGFLYAGVTSVYDSGNSADFIFGLRDEERAGKIASPRIFATGAIIASGGGYADSPFSISVTDLGPTERAAVIAQLDRKPDLQKLIFDHLGEFGRPLAPVYSDKVFTELVRLANARGIATTVHIESEEEARAALDAGIDEFAHPVRAAITDEFARMLAVKRVPVSTTLTVFSHIAMIADSADFLDGPLFKATIDPDQLAFQKLKERQRYIDSGMAAQFKVMLPYMEATVRKLNAAGVPLALGTDRTWGASTHMEIELLHKAGIPLLDLVRIATLNGAIYLHREKDLGSIERGKFADLLLLDADPTRDVAAYGRIAMVMKGGAIIDRNTLDLPVNWKTLKK